MLELRNDANILTAETWQRLAAEYLTADDERKHKGREQSRKLREWLKPLVVLDGGLLHYHGRMWHPTTNDTPYASTEQMREHWLHGKLMRVSEEHTNHPVFSTLDNLRFRVWHDTTHIEHGYDFSPNGEVRLYGAICDDLEADVRDAVFCESIYQLAVWVCDGKYPDRQWCVSLGECGREVQKRFRL